MESARLAPELSLSPRGQRITNLARWVALGLGAAGLALNLGNPLLRTRPALALTLGYAVLNLAGQLWAARHPGARWVRRTHDLVDTAAVTAGATLSGGMASPVWLLLYPHVVAVSVRAGLFWALFVGVLDAAAVFYLASVPPEQPLGELHAVTILFCAFMGGLTSSHLRRVQARLGLANLELQQANTQLSASLEENERRRVEQETSFALLRASEERYRRLLERIQDGVLIVQDAKVAFANRVFAEMVGDTAAGLVGTPMETLVAAEDRRELLDRYRRWERQETVPGQLETRLFTRQGHPLLVSLRAGSLQYEGRPALIATVRDITRERHMEQDVKAHAARLAAINEIANAVNLSLTIEDIFAVAAEEARRLVPFDCVTIALLDEFDTGVEVVAVGQGAQRRRASFARQEVQWAFRRPSAWIQDHAPAPAHLPELLAQPAVRAIATVPLMSKDRVIGSLNLGRLKADPFSTFDLGVLEPVARHIAIALDNARLLEAVRRRGQEFESLLELGRGVTERLDLDELLPMVTRSVNRVMGTHYCILLLRAGDALQVAAQEGLEPEVVRSLREVRVGDSLSGWVAQHGRPLFVFDMRHDPRLAYGDVVVKYGYRSYLCVPLRRGAEILGTLEVVTKEPRVFRDDEQELMAAFAAQAGVAIENARLFEEARRNLAHLTDANRRLEDLDRLRQEYLRNVSHEFRSPLTVIKGYAEFLAESGSPGEAGLRNITRIIVESCDRVIDMVDTLIEVSRIEQGAAERTLQVQPVDAGELVVGAVEPLQAPARKKGLALDLQPPPSRLVVQGDLGLLTQVVRKLVDNAIKYSAPGGRVVVRGRHEGEWLALDVEDTGIGIAPEHQGRIFEKFFMVDGGMTRRVGGTGVGLYLVREIVRLHKGTVGVASQVGQGSVFTVRLPLQLPAAARTQAAPP